MIEEWYDIQNRLVKAVDGIGSYIIDEIDKPFAENIAYIYDKAKAMSLDNYTTKNIFHNSKTSGVEGLSTFHEKEKISLHDLMGMAQLETIQTDNNFPDKATGIYHQQYKSYRENIKNIPFGDFIAQTFGIHDDKLTHVNKNGLLGMIGGFATHWEPHNLIQALSEIYEEEKEKNGSFLTAAILRAANTRKVPTSGKIKTSTVRVTSPKLKGSQMAACAVIGCKVIKNILGSISESELRNQLKSLREDQLGNITKIKSIYTVDEAMDIVFQNNSTIEEVAKSLNVPKEMIQSILFRELICYGAEDIAKDLVVSNYYINVESSLWVPTISPPYWILDIIKKKYFVDDSSTGLGQIFARTAIEAERTVNNNKNLSKDNWSDVWEMWKKLQDSDENIYYVGLVLKMEASRLGVDLSQATSQQIESTFVRYNGSGDGAINYGNQTMKYYELFKMYSITEERR